MKCVSEWSGIVISYQNDLITVLWNPHGFVGITVLSPEYLKDDQAGSCAGNLTNGREEEVLVHPSTQAAFTASYSQTLFP